MEKERLIIYDTDYFKQVSFDQIKNQKSCILFDTFKVMSIYDMDFSIAKEDLQSLIITNKLEIVNIPTLYDDVTIRDKIINLSVLKSKDYNVTVYTDNCSLALDLLTNYISVGTKDYSNKFSNIGKSLENDEHFLYDTCFLIKYLNYIDFSKNKHYFHTCVLEELISFKEIFFMSIYLLNTYPNNVMHINTQKTDKRGGKYSYNDLLILYSTIAYKNNFLNNNNVTFATCDRKLFFEAMYQNLFKVIDKLDYINDNHESIEETLDANLPSMDECDEDDSENLDYNDDDSFVDITITDDIDNNSVEENNNTDIKNFKKNNNIPDTWIRFPVKKICHHKILDEPDIVEKVLTRNKKYSPPVSSKAILEFCSTNAYIVFLGFYVVLKSEPDVLYKIVSLSKSEMFIEKEDIALENNIDEFTPDTKEDINETKELSNLKEEIIAQTDNYTHLYLEKYQKKHLLDMPNIIEHVYTSKFAIVAPFREARKIKKFMGITYQIHPGYYVTFKDDPSKYYKVMKISKKSATIQKL